MKEVPRYPKPEAVLQIPQYGHTLIEASAGTGKTFTIEHWVLDLLLTRALSIREILILTFSNKGAKELKSRVRDRIRQLLNLQAGTTLLPPEQCFRLDAQARDRLMAALADFDEAPIHTFHGFCSTLIGQYGFTLGLPLQSVGSQLPDERKLFGRAFRRVLRSELSANNRSQRMLSAWLEVKGSRIQNLEDLLFECHRTADELRPIFDGDRLLEAARNLPDVEDVENRLEKLVPKLSLGKVRRFLAALRAALDESCEFSLLARLEPIELSYLADKIEPLRAPLEELRASAVSLSAVLASSLLPKVRETARAMKRESELIDYDDMLTLVAEALASEHSLDLKRDLRARYKVALVDEFQDTDRVQWQILRTLFFEEGGGNPLCLVADPKQAIYGFRGADVHAYLDAKRAVVARSTVIPLVDCFRSTPELIGALNRIFEQKVDTPFFSGNVRYDRPVRAGNPDLRLIGRGEETLSPLVLLRPPWDGQKHTRKDVKRILLRGIAKEIRAIADHPPRFGERGRERRIDLRDVYVLTRTNDEAREVGEALSELGVPHVHFKQEGLFSTREAEYVLDLLRALEDPADRSRCFRAWVTPFFGLSLRDLVGCWDVSAEHPLMSRLIEWKELAESRDYATLVPRILEESGLARRLLIGANGDRLMTNYRHLFELFLEEAHRAQGTLTELVRFFEASVEDSRSQSGGEWGLQRLPSDAPAVRVMTMHMAKGLEASLVFVYALSQGRVPKAHVYHDGVVRVGFVGRLSEADPGTKAAVAREQAEEDQRLLYVALTRARGRLYLPLLPQEVTNRGIYAPLNERLETLREETDLVSVKSLRDEEPGEREESAASLRDWRPPEGLHAATEYDFVGLKERHRGRTITSYSRLKALSGGYAPYRSDAGSAVSTSPDSLPGGAAPGVFLHEVLEAVDFQTVLEESDFESWRKREDVKGLFRYYMRKNGLENRFATEAQRLVHGALATPIVQGSLRLERGLAQAGRHLREVEFVYPYPEELDRLDRGYVKGFIDLLFEHEGTLYVADWKSDTLPEWSAEAVSQHVARNYRLQARLYGLAVLKMVGVDGEGGYESSFGGILYCFLRGMPSGGIHFERPSWKEMQAFREELIRREYL